MNEITRISIVVLIAIATMVGFNHSASAQDTTEQSVNVIGCVDPDCADTVNIFTMEGATVSSYSPEGDFIQSCTVTAAGDHFDGCELMTVPLATYVVSPGPGYEAYTLLSTEPTPYDSPQTGTGLLWYFVPPSEVPDPRPEIHVTVLGCADTSCEKSPEIFTMANATVTTYNSAGELIDFCSIGEDSADLNGCLVAPPPSDGSYDIQPSSTYANYTLLSAEPVMLDGSTYAWYFAPPADEPVPTLAPPPAAAPAPVTRLPSTGSGVGPAGNQLIVYAVIPFALAAAALVSNRFARD